MKNKTPFLTFIGVSISKAHAAALADGFVDSVSDDNKDGLQPRETLTGLFLLAGEFVDSAQDNLNKNRSNNSGDLSKSIVLNDPTETGNKVSVDVMMSFYGQYLNKGVKGTKEGAGEYTFKYSTPSKKMVAALFKSIGKAQRKSVNTHAKSKSAYDVKNRKIGSVQTTRLAKAWGAASNIKMYGIKATHFVDKAAVTTSAKVSSQLGAAFKIDIINSI